MNMTQMEYAETKEMLEEVQRQPAEIRREILTMLQIGRASCRERV